MPHLLIFGPPGAGKGTQAAKISVHYTIPHISTGNLFREAYAQKTDLGREAHDMYWGKGLLVPDEITNGLAFVRLQQDDCEKGFILDGYPRTLGQAGALEEFLLEETKSLEHVFYLCCEEEVLLGRLATRIICRDCSTTYGLEIPPKEAGKCDLCPGELYTRTDDEPEKVRTRIREYVLKTTPLLDFYRRPGLLREIDGAQKAEEVFAEMERILKR